MPLTKKTRDEVIKFLREALSDTMFGDGQEDDIIMDGIEFNGLNNMSDAELLLEYARYLDADDEDDEDVLKSDKLYKKMKRETRRDENS